ncbi:hypothetical protein V2J09_014058 [Rumex salicifolius]
MSDPAQQITLFRWQFHQRRFDDATLSILESILMSTSVKSLLELQSLLREFLRSESVGAIREISDKPFEQKLSVIEFLVRAFTLVNDAESCLALRYEALVARESVSSIHPHWRVSLDEWIKFAEDSSEIGFHSIAGKACEQALLGYQNDYQKQHCSLNNLEATPEKIERLEILVRSSSLGHPVQLQTSEYLKEKNTKAVKQLSLERQICYSASASYREGIKKRNMYNLKRHQSTKQIDR